MIRQSFIRSARPLTRTFSTTTRVMAGETGSTRAGGEKAGDAFSKREKGQEDMWIKQEEKQKLLQLKQKLAEQKKHIDELSANIDEMVKNSGGEQN